MRIAMFSELPTFNPSLPNGVSSFIEAVSKQLAIIGHEVHIFEPSVYFGQEKEVKIQNNIIKHHLFSLYIRWYQDYRAPIALGTIFKKMKLRFDVIHAHGPINGFAGSILGRIQKSIKVVTYHTPGEYYRHYAPRFIPIRYDFFVDLAERIIYNTYNLVLTPAEKIREYLIKRGFDERKLFVLPNCVNLKENHKRITEEHMQCLRDRYSLNGKKVVLYVGRMSPEKRITEIVKLAPQIIKEEPNTHFLIVGKGPYLNEYKQLAQKVAPNDITFTGYVSNSDLSNLLQLSSLGLIFVGQAQVFDTILLNYWSNHVAVCARRAGGMEDIITHTDNGMLFNNQSEAYNQIITLLQDEKLCKQLAERGYETLKKKYTVETVTNRLLSYYKLAAEKFYAKGDGIIKHILRFARKRTR